MMPAAKLLMVVGSLAIAASAAAVPLTQPKYKRPTDKLWAYALAYCALAAKAWVNASAAHRLALRTSVSAAAAL